MIFDMYARAGGHCAPSVVMVAEQEDYRARYTRTVAARSFSRQKVVYK